RVLAEVEDKKGRKSLLDKALAESWTAEELAEAVREATGASAGPRQGRKLEVPKDLGGLLRQQGHVVEEFLKRSREGGEKPDHSFTSEASRLPADKLTEEEVERLKKHAERLRELSEKARQQADDAERAYAALRAKLGVTGNGEGAGASPPSPPAASPDAA